MSNFTTTRVHTQFPPPPTPYAHPEDYCSSLHLRLCKSSINIRWLVLAASVSYILTNLITTLTDVMAARIPHSREWPVITNKSRWGNSLDANTNLSKIWCVWVCAWAHSQIEVAKLSGIERNEKDIKGHFTWTLKETPDLHPQSPVSFVLGRAHHHCFFLFAIKLTILPQIGYRTFWKGFIQERG